MTYKVYANTLLLGSAQNIDDTQEFDDFQDALDYYRALFKSQAEDIADYGGEHSIMLYSVGDNKAVRVMKRNIIQTTSNNLIDEQD